MQEQSHVGNSEAQTKSSAEGSVEGNPDEDDKNDDFGFQPDVDITNNLSGILNNSNE